MKINIVLAVCMVSALHIHAQTGTFDPTLDANVTVLQAQPQETWRSAYMWYPGQLAAFYQQQCIQLSEERCVNVDYPGNFFAKCNRAYFRQEVHLDKESYIRWNGPADVVLSVNGVELAKNVRELTLPIGSSSLVFEVVTDNSLPCVIVEGAGLEQANGWQVSMDKQYWTVPESSPMYNKPYVFPDEPQEQIAQISPKEIFPVCNAEVMDIDGVRIGKNGYVLIDFYHLEVGNLAFQAKGAGLITVRVGETPEETFERDEKKLEQYPLKQIFLTEGEVKTVTLPDRALRYVALECDKGAEITSIRFDAAMWPVEHRMRFDTDNEYVNNLFKMSAATLHSSMHRFYLDGLKRDFLPWAMDALVCTLAGDYLFGDQQLSKNGIAITLMPLNPQYSDIGIPDYPLHALFGLKQNYLRYGDLTTSIQYKDRIVQLLDFYASIADENGFVHGNYGNHLFGYTPGWSIYNGPARKGIAAYAQMMLYYNYITGAYFADLWNERTLADKYRGWAKDLKAKIFDYFWDEDRKAFINGTMDDGVTIDNRISHHAQYWAILAGIFPEDCYDNLFEHILPNLPNYYEIVSYEKGYEFLTYAKAGRIKEMWKYIYRVWGDWMNQGYTRFPENFKPNAPRADQLMFYNRPYGLSLCHGANGVPVVIAALHGILGFSQSDKRINEYTFRPELMQLKHVTACIPIKEGVFKIKLNAVGESSIEIPEGCVVRMVTGTNTKQHVWKKAGTYTFQLEGM